LVVRKTGQDVEPQQHYRIRAIEKRPYMYPAFRFILLLSCYVTRIAQEPARCIRKHMHRKTRLPHNVYGSWREHMVVDPCQGLDLRNDREKTASLIRARGAEKQRGGEFCGVAAESFMSYEEYVHICRQILQ
jgi:hypothetical protein